MTSCLFLTEMAESLLNLNQPLLNNKQTETLQARYQLNRKPSSSELLEMSKELLVDTHLLHKWFQSRRANDERENHRECSLDLQGPNSTHANSRLYEEGKLQGWPYLNRNYNSYTTKC